MATEIDGYLNTDGWPTGSPNGGPYHSGAYQLTFNVNTDMSDGGGWDCSYTNCGSGITNFGFAWGGYSPPGGAYNADAIGSLLYRYDGISYWLQFAPYGYWYLGGDRTDPKNWLPVDYTSPQTRFRGRQGDLPKGGFYVTDIVAALIIPYRNDSTFHSVLYCLDMATMANLWKRDFGALQLAVQTCALVSAGKLYFWRPGMVHQIDPATGADLSNISLPDSATWTHADMIAEDGRIVIAGNSGRYDIT